MSSLTLSDKKILEAAFNMASGYVLDFSDKTFSEFFAELDVNIDASEYHKNGTSKANRLRVFWEIPNNALVGRSIIEMASMMMADVLANRSGSRAAFMTPGATAIYEEKRKMSEQVEKIGNKLLAMDDTVNKSQASSTAVKRDNMNKIQILESLIQQGEGISTRTTMQRTTASFNPMTRQRTYRETTVLSDPSEYIAWRTQLDLFLKDNQMPAFLDAGHNKLQELKHNIAKIKGLLNNWKISQDSSEIVTSKTDLVSDSIVDIDFPIVAKTAEAKKLEKIWNEMRLQLSIQQTPYSLGGMLRVLLELSTDYYMQKNIPTESINKTLNKKIVLVTQSLKERNLINNTKEKTIIGHVGIQQKSILDSFLHDLNGNPARQSLEAIWGNYKEYIIKCLQC
jgi:hypothetical protein